MPINFPLQFHRDRLCNLYSFFDPPPSSKSWLLFYEFDRRHDFSIGKRKRWIIFFLFRSGLAIDERRWFRVKDFDLSCFFFFWWVIFFIRELCLGNGNDRKVRDRRGAEKVRTLSSKTWVHDWEGGRWSGGFKNEKHKNVSTIRRETLCSHYLALSLFQIYVDSTARVYMVLLKLWCE